MNTPSTLLTAVSPLPSAGIRLMARLGFAAIGTVYLLMGVLGVVAAGLVAFGLHMLVQARYPVLRGV